MNTRDYETGYENVSAATVVLPDRLTHVTEKGADHPSVFAKGAPDATPGGVYWGSGGVGGIGAGAVPDINNLGDWEKEVTVPAGWKAYRPGEEPVHSCEPEESKEDLGGGAGSDEEGGGKRQSEESSILPFPNYGKRVFLNDSSLPFQASEEWAGSRAGKVFRLGSQGLGYYEDISLAELISSNMT